MGWKFINKIPIQTGSYWTPQSIASKVLFWGKVSEITGGQMPNKVTGSTDYLTITGTGLNARYRTPDDDAYRAADTDYCWWKTNASESTCDGNRLIAYDFARTIVKYDNTSPYTIREIIILVAGATLTSAEYNHLHTYMQLPLFWSGVENIYGVIKGNRGLAQNVWTPETTTDADSNAYFARMAVQPNDATKVLIDTFIKGLKTDLVWTELDAYSLYFLHTQQASLLNIKGDDALNHTVVLAPTWTAKTGYEIIANSYIRTHFIPSINGVKYTLNDAGIFFESIEDAFNGLEGCSDGINISFVPHYGYYAFTAINSPGFASMRMLCFESGFNALVRPDANNFIWRTESIEGTVALASSALPTKEFFIGMANENGTPRYGPTGIKYKSYGLGSSMTLTKRAALQTRLETLYSGIQTAF